MPTWISVLVAMAGGALFLVLLLGLALKVILPRVIRKGVGAMFGAKAAALKGAELRVGSVSPADGPPRQAFTNDEDHRSTAETERFGGRWVRIEATVTPRPPVVNRSSGSRVKLPKIIALLMYMLVFLTSGAS